MAIPKLNQPTLYPGMTDDYQKEQNRDTGKLSRSLSLTDIIFLTMGVILGAGIYAIIGEAAGMAGNMLWLGFFTAGFVALLSALSYAEFVSRFPDAGGSFEYIKQAFGNTTALVFGTGTVFTGIIASAAIAISFADYLGQLWDISDSLAIIGIVIILGGVNVIGIKHSSVTNIVATIVTVLGLLFVVVLGIPEWGSVDYLEMPSDGINGILSAGALTFFAYVGFEDVVKTSEETKDPKKTVSKGIVMAGLMVIVIYILVAVSTVSLKDYQELAGSGSPLALAIEGSTGKIGLTAIVVVALFATANSILTNILGTARLVFDIARDTEITWMQKLSYIPKKFSTPVYATIVIVILTIAFGLIGNLKLVASISNFFVYAVFLGVNVSLIWWRHTHREAELAPFHVPLNINKIPVPTILAILTLLVLLGYNTYNLVSGQGGGH